MNQTRGDAWAVDRIWKNVRWGVREALWYVAFYTVLGSIFVVAQLVTGMGDAEPWWLLGVPAVYFAGGVSAGAIVGLLRPLTRTLFGLLVTGVLAAVPVVLAGRIFLYGFAPWTSLDSTLVVVMSLVFGIGASLILRE